MPEDPVYTCSTCSGRGVDEGAICTQCYGAGITNSEAIQDLVKKRICLVDSKCDAIQIYLETMREDLTTALTAIWNKVKDL